MMLNLARARRHAFFTLLELNEFQNASLSLREHALCSPGIISVQVQMNSFSFVQRSEAAIEERGNSASVAVALWATRGSTSK
jgi:hypothetical protein